MYCSSQAKSAFACFIYEFKDNASVSSQVPFFQWQLLRILQSLQRTVFSNTVISKVVNCKYVLTVSISSLSSYLPMQAYIFARGLRSTDFSICIIFLKIKSAKNCWSNHGHRWTSNIPKSQANESRLLSCTLLLFLQQLEQSRFSWNAYGTNHFVRF